VPTRCAEKGTHPIAPSHFLLALFRLLSLSGIIQVSHPMLLAAVYGVHFHLFTFNFEVNKRPYQLHSELYRVVID